MPYQSLRCPRCAAETQVVPEQLDPNMKCAACGAEWLIPANGPLASAPAVSAEAGILAARTAPAPRRSARPPYLFSLAVVPLGIVGLLVGGSAVAGWELRQPLLRGGALGVGLMIVCLIVAAITRLPVWGRMLLSLALMTGGYAVGIWMLIHWGMSGGPGGFGKVSWREFTPPDGSCRVEFPGPAHLERSDPGETATYVCWIDDDNGCTLSLSRFPSLDSDRVPVEQHYTILRDWLKAGILNAQLKAERSVTLQDTYPGREFEFEQDAPIPSRAIYRAYLVKGRLYLLAVGGSRIRSDAPDTQRFLNSLRIIDPDADRDR